MRSASAEEISWELSSHSLISLFQSMTGKCCLRESRRGWNATACSPSNKAEISGPCGAASVENGVDSSD